MTRTVALLRLGVRTNKPDGFERLIANADMRRASAARYRRPTYRRTSWPMKASSASTGISRLTIRSQAPMDARGHHSDIGILRRVRRATRYLDGTAKDTTLADGTQTPASLSPAPLTVIASTGTSRARTLTSSPVQSNT